MPSYTFRDSTGREWTEFMSMSEHAEFLKSNPEVEQVMVPTPLLDPTGMSIKGVKNKPDNGFRDLLKDMKKKHSQGLSKSAINTF
jgi:hypothetical protein